MDRSQPKNPQLLSCSLLFILLAVQVPSCFPFYLYNYELKDLEGTTVTAFQSEATAWTASSTPNPLSLIQYCGADVIFGGYSLFGLNYYLTRTYTALPSHNIIHYTIQTYIIDTWDGGTSDFFLLNFDTTSLEVRGLVFSTLFTSNLCGQSSRVDSTIIVQGSVPHTGPSLTFTVTSHLNQSLLDESFGFRGVSFIFANSSSPSQSLCLISSSDLSSINSCYAPLGKFKNGTTYSTCNPACKACIGPTNLDCKECSDNHYFSGSGCAPFVNNCASFSTPRSQICTACAQGFQLIENKCEITVVLNTDIVKPITNGHILQATVNPKTGIIDTLDEFLIIKIDSLTEGIDYSLLSEKVSKGFFLITIKAIRPIGLNSLQTHVTYSPNRLKLKGTVTTPKIVHLSDAHNTAVENIRTTSNWLFWILIACAVLLLLLKRISNVLSFVVMNQYLHYLLYLNVNYLSYTKVYFKTLRLYGMIFVSNDLPLTNAAILLTAKKSMPARFFEEDFSPDFLKNASPTIGLLLFLALSLSFLTLLIRQVFPNLKFLKKLRDSLRWSTPIRQSIAFSLPIMVSCLLELNRTMFGNSPEWMSFTIALMTITGLMLFFMKSFQIIENIPGKRNKKVIYTDFYGALWYGLNTRTSVRLYYWIVALRGLLLAYLVVFFDLFIWIQLSILTIFQAATLGLFIGRQGIKKVLRENLLNLSNLVTEFLLLLMHFTIFLFAAVYAYEDGDDVLIVTGWMIIGIGFLIQFIQIVYSLTVIAQSWRALRSSARNLIDRLRRKPLRKKIRRIVNLGDNSELNLKIQTMGEKSQLDRTTKIKLFQTDFK